MKLRYIAEAGKNIQRIDWPRIRELAKEIGISPITLQKYSRLGCPLTSAEDIQKWREKNFIFRPDFLSAQNQASDFESNTPRRFTNTGKIYNDDDSVAKQREGDLGKYTASIIPFGYRLNDENKFVLDHSEQAIIKRMLSRREDGATYKEIARELSADGIPTKTGMDRWSPVTVAVIIRRHTPESQKESGSKYPTQEITDKILKRRAEGATLQQIADELNADGIKTAKGSRWISQYISNYISSYINKRRDTAKRRKIRMIDTPDEAVGGARQFSNTGQEYYNDDTIAQARNSPYDKYTISAVPFGFRLNDDRTELLVDPVEQAIIKRIRKLKTEGLKLQEIADILNAEDIKTKTGSKWTQPILYALIKKTDTPSSKLTGSQHARRTPYGYKSKSVENPEEQAVISRVAKRISEGARLREIADELNADGIRTRYGKPWTISSVEMIVGRAIKRKQAGTRHISYGYKHGENGVVADPTEQAIIDRIRKRRMGGASISQVADELNAEGVETRDGKPWTATFVSKISDRIFKKSYEQAVMNRIHGRITSGASTSQVADELNAEGVKTKDGKQWTAALVLKANDNKIKQILDKRLKRRSKTQNQTSDSAAPYGYRLNDNGIGFIADPAEQAVIEKIRRRREEGASFAKIAKELNDGGIKTKKGKNWFPMSILEILKRKPIIAVNNTLPESRRNFRSLLESILND